MDISIQSPETTAAPGCDALMKQKSQDARDSIKPSPQPESKCPVAVVSDDSQMDHTLAASSASADEPPDGGVKAWLQVRAT